MRATLLIAAKDLRLRLRDRSLLLFALVLPLALAFVFSLTFSGAEDQSDAFDYATVNLDRGPIAATFTDHLLPELAAEGVIAVRPVATETAGRELLERGEIAALFVVPEGFSGAVESGQPAGLRVIGDPDAGLATQVARSIAESYTGQLQSVRLSVATATAGEPVDPARLAELAGQAVTWPDSVRVTDLSAGSRELDLETYLSAGMAVFFLFFTVSFGVASLYQEGLDGTLPRLLAAPIPRPAVIAAKLLTSLLVGVISLGMLVVATSLLLGARWGDPLGVAILAVAGVVAAIGVMAVVLVLARSAEQGQNFQSIVAVVLGMLGGAFFPIAQIGGPLATLSYLAPHRWFLRGLADLSGGGGVGVIWPSVGVLLLFGVVLTGLALPRMVATVNAGATRWH
jgi:ABC-2 type transport system permease protein